MTRLSVVSAAAYAALALGAASCVTAQQLPPPNPASRIGKAVKPPPTPAPAAVPVVSAVKAEAARAANGPAAGPPVVPDGLAKDFFKAQANQAAAERDLEHWQAAWRAARDAIAELCAGKTGEFTPAFNVNGDPVCVRKPEGKRP